MYNSSIFMILYVKMSLFDDLFNTSFNCDINFDIWEDINSEDDGPDEVCLSNHETGLLSETSQFTTPSLARLEERTDKKGHLIGTRINALIKFDKGTPLDFDAIRIKTSIIKSSVYRLRLKAISRD
jgi:hypothetical protein